MSTFTPFLKISFRRAVPAIFYIFWGPLTEDGQTIENRKRVELEAPKIHVKM